MADNSMDFFPWNRIRGGMSGRFLFLACSVCAAGSAQQYVISTLAGAPAPDGIQATSAAVYPRTVARDASGSIYFPDYNRVYRISANGTLAVVAGSGIELSSGDGGAATAAAINSPNGLAFDAGGNLFMAQLNQIRKVSAATGAITTIAGSDASGFSGDNGPAAPPC